jgi:hypothetical protein
MAQKVCIIIAEKNQTGDWREFSPKQPIFGAKYPESSLERDCGNLRIVGCGQ